MQQHSFAELLGMFLGAIAMNALFALIAKYVYQAISLAGSFGWPDYPWSLFFWVILGVGLIKHMVTSK